MPHQKKDAALYTLRVAKKGTEQLPLILQFTDRDVFQDTYYEIKFRRDDLMIIDKSDGTMIFESKEAALQTVDIFLR